MRFSPFLGSRKHICDSPWSTHVLFIFREAQMCFMWKHKCASLWSTPVLFTFQKHRCASCGSTFMSFTFQRSPDVGSTSCRSIVVFLFLGSTIVLFYHMARFMLGKKVNFSWKSRKKTKHNTKSKKKHVQKKQRKRVFHGCASVWHVTALWRTTWRVGSVPTHVRAGKKQRGTR